MSGKHYCKAGPTVTLFINAIDRHFSDSPLVIRDWGVLCKVRRIREEDLFAKIYLRALETSKT